MFVFRFSLFAIFAIANSQILLAQNSFKLSGRLWNKELNSPVSETILSLRRSSTGQLMKSVLTDSTGHFEFVISQNDSVNLHWVRVSGDTVLRENLFMNGDIDLAYLRVYLPRGKSLSTVNVVAKQNFIEKKLDKLVVHPNALASNACLTVFEVLSKSPGVIIDANDQIVMKGKSGVLVFSNGKQIFLSGADLTNYLKSLPASSISTIEFITNPSAKFDAAGNAGIINLTQKKSTTKGYSGNLSLSYGQGFYARTNNSLTINYNIGKWNFNSLLAYSETNFYQDLTVRRRYFDDQSSLNSAFKQHSFLKIHRSGKNMKLGADYYLSKKSTLGFSINGFMNRNYQDIENNSTILDANLTTTQIVQTTNPLRQRLDNLNFNINYSLSIDSTGQELTVNADYLNFDGGVEQNLLSIYKNPSQIETDRSRLVSQLPTGIEIYSAKLDYEKPLASKLKMETGLKTSFVNTKNAANFFDAIGDSLKPNTYFSNAFDYKETIHAGYVNLNWDKGRWSFQSGLRAEITEIRGDQSARTQLRDSSFTSNYLSWFPTLYVGYTLDSNGHHIFGFSYGRRIDRPNYKDMNPFIYPLDRFTLYGGNPFLVPSFSNNLEWTYSFKGQTNLSLFYSYVGNMINETVETRSNIFYSRPGNIGQQSTLGISYDGNYTLTKWWSLQLHTELVYNNFTSDLYGTRLENKATYWQVSPINIIQLPDRWTGEISGSYQTAAPGGQFLLIPIGSVNIALSKKFFKDQFTFKASLNDVFYTFQPGGEIKGLKNSQAEWLSFLDTRIFNLSASYRVGSPIFRTIAKLL